MNNCSDLVREKRRPKHRAKTHGKQGKNKSLNKPTQCAQGVAEPLLVYSHLSWKWLSGIELRVMKTYKKASRFIVTPKWLRCSLREKVPLMAHGRIFIKMPLWTFLSVANSLTTKISPPTLICFSVCFAKVSACHLLYLHSAKNPGEK